MQVDSRDFDGVDVSWLAQDATGAIAVFVTGGAGPIPPAAVSTLSDAEEQALALPVRCDARLHISMPRPDDFLELARRGLFVYDWPHPGATRSTDGSYCLAASPLDPLRVSDTDLERALPTCKVKMAAVFGSSDMSVAV